MTPVEVTVLALAGLAVASLVERSIAHRRARRAEYVGPRPPSFVATVARVIDGDTVRLLYQEQWVTIRIHGIDAPERDQCGHSPTLLGRLAGPCPIGRRAAAHLGTLLRGRTVTCTVVARDRYGRFIGVLRTQEGDVGGMMVRAGWAVAYVQYDGERYYSDEVAAKTTGVGMWAYEVVEPARWRRGYR